MKLSVSLPAEDLAFLDSYARAGSIGSRSAVLHRAIRLLLAAEMRSDYEEAWEEWAVSGEDEAWEPVTEDGLRS